MRAGGAAADFTHFAVDDDCEHSLGSVLSKEHTREALGGEGGEEERGRGREKGACEILWFG